MIRNDGRLENELRPLQIEINYTMYADGSVLISGGNTKIICTASVENKVPAWLLDKNKNPRHGWLTAEYRMLPSSTDVRKNRELITVDGRTQEIQRLIGRSLRSIIDLDSLGNNTIRIDCDVIQADGGTRTMAITGSYIALILALRKIYSTGKLKIFPVTKFLAAVSVGILNQNCILDLKYDEDKIAEVDMNIVMLDSGEFVEIQGTAEAQAYSRLQLNSMLDLASNGISSIISLQKEILGKELPRQTTFKN